MELPIYFVVDQNAKPLNNNKFPSSSEAMDFAKKSASALGHLIHVWMYRGPERSFYASIDSLGKVIKEHPHEMHKVVSHYLGECVADLKKGGAVSLAKEIEAISSRL